MPPNPRALPLPLLVILGTLIFVSMLAAQEVPRLQLGVKEVLPITAGFARRVGFFGPVECDGAGNIYVRFATSRDPSASPLVKISADGKKVTPFYLDSVPGLETSKIDRFTVGLRGEVFVFAFKGPELNMVEFRDDGQYESTTQVGLHFSPAQFAVFPTGEFLTSGTEVPTGEPQGAPPHPFTAIFDGNGRITRKLELPDKTKTKHADSSQEQSEIFDLAIALGAAVAAEDGNIYLMRAGAMPVVYVISPGGEVLRHLVLKSPGEDFRSGGMKVAGGKVLIEFHKPHSDPNFGDVFIYSLYDAESGERVLDYEEMPERGILACYTPNYFTFVDVSNGGLQLVHAVPR